ncbi:FG-GAP repeat domain-containing protein [Propionibacteriaceae bacterium G1746]
MTIRPLRALAGLALAFALAATLSPSALADDTESAPARPGTRSATSWTNAAPQATTPAPTLAPQASVEESNAVARLNAYRARAGLRPLALVGAPGAVVNHAKYLDQNIGVAGLNPFMEDPSLPGYTAAGDAIAVETWPGFSETGTYSQVVDDWLANPEAQYWELLDPTTAQIAFTRQGAVIVAWFGHSAATAPEPVVFPQGPNFGLRTMPADYSALFTLGCSARATWGFPITFQWDPGLYEQMLVNNVSVRVDGSAVGVCIVNNTSQLAAPGQVVVIPEQPFAPGTQVSASVSVTGFLADGSGSAQLAATSEFSVQAPASGVLGDQTGDATADVLAVTASGDLWLYKGRRPGTIGHGYQIGRGWNEFTWFSHTPDVNGDRRDDLIGRRSDGHLYLYFGQGNGSYTAGRKVGQNWGGLRNLTVVGDMNADGTPEVVGIGENGNLYRYTLTQNGFVGASLIGKNWQGIAMTASVGSFNANTDRYADLIAVGTNGRLYVYYSGANGLFIQAAVIGQGWSGFTALFSPGDLSGDGRPDLIGRNAAGTLYSYENRAGSWGAARQAGTGWGGIRLFG